MTPAHAFFETPFLSAAFLAADAALKHAGVSLRLAETTLGGELCLVFTGPLDALQSSLDQAQLVARACHIPNTLRFLLPNPAQTPPIDTLLSVNALTQSREQLLPHPHPDPMNHLALGIIETQGLAAILDATDAMLKAADVTLAGKEKIGAAYVSIFIRGDVAAVQAALDAGRASVQSSGATLIAARLIPRPHPDLLALLP